MIPPIPEFKLTLEQQFKLRQYENIIETQFTEAQAKELLLQMLRTDMLKQNLIKNMTKQLLERS